MQTLSTPRLRLRPFTEVDDVDLGFAFLSAARGQGFAGEAAAGHRGSMSPRRAAPAVMR